MIFSIDNVFRFLNFLVVCVGGAYLMRRYGILYVVTLMRLEKQKQEEKKQEYDTVLEQCDLIELRNHDQELAYAAMKEKFQVWQVNVQQGIASKQKSLEQCRQELKQKQILKIQNVQRQHIIQQQLPMMLKEISNDLQIKFEQNPQRQKEYTAQLIKFVTEREL